MTTFGHVTDGHERESLDGTQFGSIDPWTHEPWADVTLGGAPEADLAVTAARRAFDEGPWPRIGYGQRGALPHRLADLIQEHGQELTNADSRDMGRPVDDARGKDVPRTAQNFRFLANHARLATSKTYPSDTGHHAYARCQPAGVVTAIAPSTKERVGQLLVPGDQISEPPHLGAEFALSANAVSTLAYRARQRLKCVFLRSQRQLPDAAAVQPALLVSFGAPVVPQLGTDDGSSPMDEGSAAAP